MKSRWWRRAAVGLSLLAVGVFMGHAVVHGVLGADRAENGHCVLCHASLAPALAPPPVTAPVAGLAVALVVVLVAVPVRTVLPSDPRAPPFA